MQLKFYKSGQGYQTRLWTALIAFAIIALGCARLYQELRGSGNQWIYTLVPLGVAAGFAVLIYWLSNRPGVADFLIQAEGEVKKVSWSSRQEVILSTTVVIVVVIFLSSTLFAADWIFGYLTKEILGI